ncbi:MAG: hypothetical protein JWQ38_2424 [Flavipsychrobacter sp.]|nr:hypothetical protein [Flavipsychrobacter sp.]
MRHIAASFSRLQLLIIGLIIVTLTSCQKEVHIDLGTSPTQIVVEGQIENGQPPFVLLTSTLSFFSNIDLKSLEKSFIHNAVVTVSNGSKTMTLREYSLDTAGSKFYAYTIDTANFSNLFVGEIGKSYTLTVTSNGNTYTSVTKIPAPKDVDTLWFAEPEFKNDKTPGNAQQLFANYTDPDTPGNYVRYYTQRNGKGFYPVGIFSDEIVNGKVISNISLIAGYEHTVDANGDSLRYFYPGDTVTLKWCEIDKGVYTFWNTDQFAANAVGNPFASPINTTSNISNGALGVWAGYGSILKTIIVPH